MEIRNWRAERKDLAETLRRAMKLGGELLDDGLFTRLAVSLFRHQHEHLGPYRRLCERRGVAPGQVTDYRAIPAVPTTAFKELALFAGPESEVAQVFSTSGTSGGDRKGRSFFSRAGLDLMEHSIRINAARMLFPDCRRMPILVLAPPPELAPQMIMAWGMARLIRHFGTRDSAFLIGRQGLDEAGLAARLRHSQDSNEPVTLIGASFGFVNLLERMRDRKTRFQLPPGSRLMDAGGYKGKSRTLARNELEEWIAEGFGIGPDRHVNLLGMTELASQLYDDTLEMSAQGKRPSRKKKNPPWTRTRVVDPETLADVPAGEPGVLLHLDLANLDTPMAVLTDDVGVADPAGFEILGRAAADDSRGCSLTVDELMRRRP
jgi:hypothetical protein